MESSENFGSIYDEVNEEIEIKPLKKSQLIGTKQTFVGNYFQYQQAKDSIPVPLFFELRDSYIFVKKNEQGVDIGFMNIKNASIKIKEKFQVHGKEYLAIKFVKLKSYEEILTQEEQVLNQWIYYLKPFCIFTKISRYYSTIKVLGKGSFASVYLVESKQTKQKFAAKVFSKDMMNESQGFEKKCLINEIKIMQTLNHPRIVKIFEQYESLKYFYCLNELFDGQDLFDAIITKGEQPERKCMSIIYQILETLSYMHSQGFMHRDIKPENIIFRKTNQQIDIGIIDFGFSCTVKDYNKLFTRCGTPGYVAPEILRDQPYDCKIDVFSTGIIFYMIMTGRMPFSGKTYSEIVEKNLLAKVNFNFENFNIQISQKAKDLMKQMLEPNPKKRLSSIEALNHCVFQEASFSQSPLIVRNEYNPESLIRFKQLTKEVDNRCFDQLKKETQQKDKFPDRLEDLSPTPYDKNQNNFKNFYADNFTKLDK